MMDRMEAVREVLSCPRVARIVIAAAFLNISCGNSTSAVDLKPGGDAWDFYEPHPIRIHSRAEATAMHWPPTCAEYPLVLRMDYTTLENHAAWGENAVWNSENPRVWISPRGWASERATHYFECWLDYRYGEHALSDMAFSCRGGMAIPREAYESDWIHPPFEDGATTMVWAYYNEDRTQHLASFQFDFIVYQHEDNYGGKCITLEFDGTKRRLEAIR